MLDMIRINQTLQTPVHCRYRTVTAALCPTSDQEANSMLKQALENTEIRDYPTRTEVLALANKASTTILTYPQASANLQSP